ncbi:hypothetical protein [Falsirhodobacter sp. 1013]
MKLAPTPTLHQPMALTNSNLGSCTEVGADSVLTHAIRGHYSS